MMRVPPKQTDRVQVKIKELLLVFDPSVPDWARQPEKPKYNAEEVGALPADTKIPSKPEDVGALPDNTKIPSKAADVGAIAVPAVAAVGQTIRVSEVDENGMPIKWEAFDFPVGGEAKYEKIVDNAAISAYEVNALEFANIGGYDDFILDGMFLDSGTSSGVTLYLNGIKVSSGFGQYMVHADYTKRTVLRLMLDRKRKTYICCLSLMGYNTADCYEIAIKQGNIETINEEITSFRLKLAKNVYYTPGSTYTLWGRKRDV